MLSKPHEAINVSFLSKKSRSFIFLVMLILMSVSGLVGSDLYLPALPTIGHYFGVSQPEMQGTLSIYLVGLSVSQLIYGPLSDRFGRKWPLVFGMAIYFLSSAICTVTHNFDVFMVARFSQAFGACAGLTIGRVIVGDCFNAKDSASMFSTIFPFVGMSPAISPVIGGFLATYFGWRTTLGFVGFFALINLLLVFFVLNETLLIDKNNRPSVHPKKILINYISLLGKLKFWMYALVPCFSYFAYFGYIAESPFIFHQQGYGAFAIGFFYITLSITYLAGSFSGKRLLKNTSLNKGIFIGYVIFLLGGLGLCLSSQVMGFNLVLMLVFISILTFGNGFLIPQGTAGVISNFQENRGTASGLLGFFQLGSAALTSLFVHYFSHSSLKGLGLYICIVCFLGIVLFAICMRYDKLEKNNV